MNVWIVTIYEPLPLFASETRPQRCGMLTDALIKKGHKVVLWTSTFEHVKKKHHYCHSITLQVGEDVTIKLLHAPGYTNDKSFARFRHNRITAREFKKISEQSMPLPDIIFAPVPILELAESCTEYASTHKIPIVLDVRDLWPDIYLSILPKWSHLVARILLRTEFQRATRIFTQVTGITAVSKSYLDWGLRHANRKISDRDHFFPLCFPELSLPEVENFEKMKIELMSEYSIQHNEILIAFAGSFCASYALEAVLYAARKLIRNADSNFRFIIMGDGDGSRRFHSIAEKLDNVTLTGWVDNLKLQTLLKMSTIGLAPYASNALMSLPNKPFEYMAAGLPILSSLKGDLEDLISKNKIGRQYDPEDSNSLVEQLEWFCQHPNETAEMGKRSKTLFLKEFKSEVIYSRIVNHLENIVLSGIGEHGES